jgi:hypothetical protein
LPPMRAAPSHARRVPVAVQRQRPGPVRVQQRPRVNYAGFTRAGSSKTSSYGGIIAPHVVK